VALDHELQHRYRWRLPVGVLVIGLGQFLAVRLPTSQYVRATRGYGVSAVPSWPGHAIAGQSSTHKLSRNSVGARHTARFFVSILFTDECCETMCK